MEGSEALEFLLSEDHSFWVPVAPPGFSLAVSRIYKVGGAADLSLPNLAVVFAVPLVYCAREAEAKRLGDGL